MGGKNNNMYMPKSAVPIQDGETGSNYSPRSAVPILDEPKRGNTAGDILNTIGGGLLSLERKIPGVGLTQDVGYGTAQLVDKLLGTPSSQTKQMYSGFLPDETLQQMGDHPVTRIAKDVAGVASYPAQKVPFIGNALSGGLTEASREGASPLSIGGAAVTNAILGPLVEKLFGGISSKIGSSIFGEQGNKLPQIIEETGGKPIIGTGKQVQQQIAERTIEPFSQKAKSALGKATIDRAGYEKMIEQAFPSVIISSLPNKSESALGQERALLENIGNKLFSQGGNESIPVSELYDQYISHNKFLGNSDAMKALGSFLHSVAEDSSYAKYQGLKQAAGSMAGSAFNKGESFVNKQAMRISPWLVAHLLGAGAAGAATGNVPAAIGLPAALFGTEMMATNPTVGLPLASLFAPGAQVVPGMENRAIQQLLSRLAGSQLSQAIFPPEGQ